MGNFPEFCELHSAFLQIDCFQGTRGTHSNGDPVQGRLSESKTVDANLHLKIANGLLFFKVVANPMY